MQTHALDVHLIYADQWHTLDSECLSRTERERAAQFRLAAPRTLYQAAHAFLRQVLSLYAPLRPQAWCFSTNPYGKPCITNPHYESIQFNLSHTEGLVACVVAHNITVGIDIERIQPMEDLAAVARYTFAPCEAEAVLALSDPLQQQQRFFTYWTLKEACLKAWGTGFSLPPQSFTLVQDQQEQWVMQDTPSLFTSKQKLCLRSYLVKDYCLGLAWKQNEANGNQRTDYQVVIYEADQKPMTLSA
ncbi:MAG: 4'-phosphopantetheinyl transferase superfamily protein [Thiofilum sp.]|uniref:4'-phosphopantetheinyl transferase superfamily protein n=1 Tax=Thiofilum sp. TaxID=2212733 RepID=UPI0025E2F19A|nr:4'-phosphopantetheinyl transferase superfamily protein [Thiofilum sp.]MBK8452739.1 4'-phosphopantetheinyl transferase superfamily protein [Thiofilum sp.]